MLFALSIVGVGMYLNAVSIGACVIGTCMKKCNVLFLTMNDDGAVATSLPV